MPESVLSNEEVEALLKVSQDKFEDLDKIIGTIDSPIEKIKQNSQVISSINDLTRLELEKSLSSFYRNKIFVKSTSANISKASECFNNEEHNNIYIAFRLMPHECYGIFNINNFFIHQTINVLYGGKINKDDQIIETPGKIGMMIAEKITQIFLDAFVLSCREYGPVNHEILKGTTTLALAYNYGVEEHDDIYLLEYSVLLDEIENKIKFVVTEEFVNKFFQKKSDPNKNRKKEFWQDAIKTQVVDSIVNISISLPDVSMKANDFLNLKEGDLIPIGDPTMVYVCLNNYKLFRAVAGQSNSNLVVKITEQI